MTHGKLLSMVPNIVLGKVYPCTLWNKMCSVRKTKGLKMAYDQGKECKDFHQYHIEIGGYNKWEKHQKEIN